MKFKTPYKSLSIAALGAVCVLSVLSGCKKYVDIDLPRKTITTIDAFSSNQQVASTLAGMYSQMLTNTGSLVFSNGATTIYGGLSSDELVSYAGVGSTTDYQFETNTLRSDNLVADNYFWGPAYRIINTANNVIEGVSASTSSLLTDSARKEATAEAKFVRSFCYFYLTNFYGDVPLVLSTDFNQTATSRNTPQADIYKQLVTDLLEAKAVMPADYKVAGTTGEKIRPNKWAATALLARIYLYQKDWKNAEAQATAVIGSGQYSLTSTLGGVFAKNSSEAILQLQQNPTVTPYNSTFEGKNFIPNFLWTSFSASDQATILVPATFAAYAPQLIPKYYASASLVSAFEANDKRKTTWLNYTATANIAPYNGVTLYYPYKYTSNTSTTTVASVAQYYMLLRLAEQYLIRAEARAQQSDVAGAATDLNLIRTRAGLPNTTAATQADMLTAVLHERQVELFAEWAHRWLDLKRTGNAKTVLSAISYKQPFNDYQLLYPIAYTELKADAYLQQNPGY